MELMFLWLVMALICAMVAGSKKGVGTGFVFFFYGLLLWPIALVHALLLTRSDPADNARTRDLKAAEGGEWLPCQVSAEIEYADPELGRLRFLVNGYGLSRKHDPLARRTRVWLRGETGGEPAAFRIDRIKSLVETDTGERPARPAAWLEARSASLSGERGANPEAGRGANESSGSARPSR